MTVYDFCGQRFFGLPLLAALRRSSAPTGR